MEVKTRENHKIKTSLGYIEIQHQTGQLNKTDSQKPENKQTKGKKKIKKEKKKEVLGI